MAKIERYVAGPSKVSGGGITIPYSGGGRGMPQNAGQGFITAGNALQSISQDVQEVDEHFKRARQSSLMSSLQVGLAREISDIELEYNERQDYEKFQEDITTRISKMRQDYMDKIGDDHEVLDAFMPTFDLKAIELNGGIRKLSRAKFVDSDKAALGNELDNIYEIANRNTNDYGKVSGEIRALGRSAIAGRVASGVISAAQGQAELSSFDDKYWNNYLTSQVRQNPIETEEMLKDDKMFPGLDVDSRLQWQGIVAEAASTKIVENTVFGLIGTHGNDFGAMRADLEKVKGLDRYEKSKALDMLETAETQYNQHIEEIRKEGKAKELSNVYGMMNDGKLIGAMRAVDNSEYLTEEEKFQRKEALKKWQKGELWTTDPILESKFIREIDSGILTDPGKIENSRGLGLSNSTTDKLKKRCEEHGKNPIKDSIIKDTVSYGKSQWISQFPKKEGLDAHFAYAQFQIEMRDKLEQLISDAEEKGKPFTRADAIKHIDEYFEIKKKDIKFWPIDKKYVEAENLAEKYTEKKSSVPEDEYKKIEEYLGKKNISPTRENIEKAYEQNKGTPSFEKLMGRQPDEKKAENPKQEESKTVEQKQGTVSNNFGNREDGTKKGNGWLGQLKTKDGEISTELSIGVEIDGKETLIPSLVPTLTKDEIDYLLSGGEPTDKIVKKATDHAMKRIRAGKSPFKD